MTVHCSKTLSQSFHLVLVISHPNSIRVDMAVVIQANLVTQQKNYFQSL